jgi:acyl transferase domain-containing protein
VLGSSREELMAGLEALARAEQAPNLIEGTAREGRRVEYAESMNLEAWVDGADTDRAGLVELEGRVPIELPSYAFQRKLHWISFTRLSRLLQAIQSHRSQRNGSARSSTPQ